MGNKKGLDDLLAQPDFTIRHTMKLIDTRGLQIAFVVDDHRRLLGTVTDGDIRRGILRGISIDQPVREIMNSSPLTASVSEPRERVLETMRTSFNRIPIVDRDNRVVGIHIFEELQEQPQAKENVAVFMAGGPGSRLGSLTDSCPKPLLKVGTRPLLETILMSFVEYGFHRFYLSVNYKAEMIEDYFGDGSRWNVEIKYLRETDRLGTAGALSLLPEAPDQPFFVMNGDLLTKINFEQLLAYHQEHSAAATMAIREFDFEVPYGVVRTERESVTGIDEKPVQKFFVNGGIYVLNPSVLNSLPHNMPLDMPELFQLLIDSKQKTVAFPIREYWLDVGRVSDFDRANTDFSELFPDDRR